MILDIVSNDTSIISGYKEWIIYDDLSVDCYDRFLNVKGTFVLKESDYNFIMDVYNENKDKDISSYLLDGWYLYFKEYENGVFVRQVDYPFTGDLDKNMDEVLRILNIGMNSIK